MTAESSPTGWSSPSSDRAGRPMFVVAGPFQQSEKSRCTGCPGGVVAPSGKGYFQGPVSGEAAGLVEGPARHATTAYATQQNHLRLTR